MKKLILILLKIAVFGSIFSFETPEKLTFSLEYGFITAGEATLSIRKETYCEPLIQDEPVAVYKIESTAKSNSFFDAFYKVRDTITSIWSQDNLLSLKFSKELNEGSYRQRRVHYYFHGKLLSSYEKYDFKEEKYKRSVMKIPEETRDILSAFYLTRLKDLEEFTQKKEPFYIKVTADGDNYFAKVLFLGKEKVYSPLFDKKIECYKIRPILANNALFKNEGKIVIYLTADEEKMPILLESKFLFGKFKAILRKVERL